MTEKLDLDYELLQHLTDPVAVTTLRGQEFSSKLVLDPVVKAIYDWQMEYVREQDALATNAVLEDQWEITLEKPQTAIGDLIDRLRKRYVRVQGKETVREIIREAEQDPLAIGPRMLNEGKRLSELTVKRGKIIGSDDWYKLDHFYKHESLATPASWGWRELDSHFGGLRGLTFLVARVKSFKSWFAIHAALQNVRQGHKVIFYSLEMPAEYTAGRLMCLHANVPFGKWERGSLTNYQEGRLKVAYDELREFSTYSVEKPERGSRSVRRLLEKALDQEARLVIIDQLQYLELENGRSCGSLNNTGDYWDVCEELRDYSDRLPLMAIHQYNRSTLGNFKTNERPDAQQAKGSAAIEETASTMLGLWQNREMYRREEFEIYSLAARSSVAGAWRIGYDLGEQCQFNWLGEAPNDMELT